MIPIITTVTGFLLRPLGEDKAKAGQQALAKALKDQFDPDHLLLTRDEKHFIHREQAKAADSAPAIIGETPANGEAAGVAWRQYAFAEDCTIAPCNWQGVAWRFYRNGRIAFCARMRNAGERFDRGDLQGHRIELRTRDGLLIGAWKAAFVVRRDTAVGTFPATVMDEHPLLALHFDELAERQAGLWFRVD